PSLHPLPTVPTCTSPTLLPPSFLHDPPPTELYTLSLHDALPIYHVASVARTERDHRARCEARAAGRPDLDRKPHRSRRDRLPGAPGGGHGEQCGGRGEPVRGVASAAVETALHQHVKPRRRCRPLGNPTPVIAHFV